MNILTFAAIIHLFNHRLPNLPLVVVKDMNVTSSNIPAFRRAEALKKAKKERAVQDLVVKIISWKTTNTNLKEKISASEWQKYRKHLTRISESLSKKEIEAKLKSIQEIIKKNHGFE